jgi:predicted DCC family thiol-disulfide oxidoreductase YuxK
MTDENAAQPIGWIYFDAQCPFCLAHRKRWGSVLERRGFVWRPLQTSGTAERLGITNARLQAEMWLHIADGRRFSGINAWIVLMRRVWWLWPIGVALAVPGFNAAGRALYRWVAKHRYCLGGTCTIPTRTRAPSLNQRGATSSVIPNQRQEELESRKMRRHHTAFLELP